MSKRIIIIGAGLTGLSLAYELKKKGFQSLIVEGRNRIGGRIETIKGNQNTPMEMGATWFGKKHQTLVSFLEELNISFFKQYNSGIALFETMSFAPPQKFTIPASEEPSFRIQGGSESIIKKLTQEVGNENIQLNTSISKIIKQDNYILLKTSSDVEYKCDIVISTLPPKLFAANIECTPTLPDSTLDILKHTQSWMESSVKFSVEYTSPFWRKKGMSGMAFSQSSIIPEMYDHCNFEENKFALKGFLNGSVANYNSEKREQMVIQTLKKFFGADAENHIGYFDKIWEREEFTYSDSPQFLPSHYNNGHAIYQSAIWGNQLWLAGTETSPKFGGYMEGAIFSAKQTAEKIIKNQIS